MTYDLLPFPKAREVTVDAGYLAARRHIIHGLLEVDVSRAREALQGTAGSDGRPLSFTGFLIASLAQAVAAHPQVQAYRDLRGRLVVFHDVDVALPVEPAPGVPATARLLRAANRKSLREISDEIRGMQADPRTPGGLGRLVDLAPQLPRFVRLAFFRALHLNPHWLKRMEGTVIVTSVGMFGGGGGWGIGFLMAHTLGLTVGGIADRPVARDGAVVVRPCLHLTLSFDHDVVDGAPAARFSQTFTELVESAAVLG